MTPQNYLSKVRYQIQYQYQIKLEMSITESQEKLPTFYWLNDLTKLVLSQTLAHVQLRVCLKF